MKEIVGVGEMIVGQNIKRTRRQLVLFASYLMQTCVYTLTKSIVHTKRNHTHGGGGEFIHILLQECTKIQHAFVSFQQIWMNAKAG